MIVPASVRLCEFSAQNFVQPRECHRLNMAVDELLSNIICYAYTDDLRHYIAIQMDIYPDRVELTFRDDGVFFNLMAHPEPDTSLPLEERPTGGLGIHLVRKLIHQVDYERKFGQNVVHLVQYREPAGGKEPD
jgi:anti-sigma regulatory factor (Ser/Thr protein kinase)